MSDTRLQKPIKTVLDLLPLFEDYREFRGLDLGCGVGKNCIAVAKHFKQIPCIIDCVDILELAIENYSIEENAYDLVLAVSALEHMDTKESLIRKLAEINRGIRTGGVVCLVINSEEEKNFPGAFIYC